MTETKIDEVGLRAAAVNEKLNILAKTAARAGDPVAVRIDPRSLEEMRAGSMRLGSWVQYVEPQQNGVTWNGLPCVLEVSPQRVSAIYVEGQVPKATDLEAQPPRILTIEAKDRRSGRTVYTNWGENPEGYR